MVNSDSLLHPPERIVLLDDRESGLEGAIVVHSTILGPAAGGCRYWSYGSEEDLLEDAYRLATGMAFKNAMAGLPLGGGKAVLRRRSGQGDRKAIFAAFGEAVEKLGGRYVTAEDVGTTVDDMQEVAKRTGHVAGLPALSGRPGGDPSPWTARGVFLSMKVVAEGRLSKPLRDCVVSVQGLGSVGSHLSRMLTDEGAHLVVADVDRERVVAVARMTGAKAVPVEEVLSADVDVFAPRALGSVLSVRTIPHLRAKVVCGAANNQLASVEDGALLADRGILYAPDYVVNAGGIINVAAEYLGWERADAAALVEATGSRLERVLEAARAQDCSTDTAADRLAQSIIFEAATAVGRSA